MGHNWHSTGIKGLRYREHPTRKHGVRLDRYYEIHFQKNGVRVQESLGWMSVEGYDQTQAEEQLVELRKAARIGEGPASLKEKRELKKEKDEAKEKAKRESEALNVTFKAYAEDHYFPIAEPGWKPETGRKHKEHCKIWLYPHFGDMPLRRVGITQLNRVKAAMMKKGRSPRTMQAVFRTFTMIWTSARDAGLVTEQSPAKKDSFKLPKIDNERMRFLTTEESKMLLDCVRVKNGQVADMAFVSLESGLRFGEVASLTWCKVDLKNNSLTVMNTKGGRDRIVPMTSRLHNLFSDMTEGKANAVVFPNRHGKAHKQVPSQFKRGVEESKLNEDVEDRKMKVSFHSLRHTYASRMVQNGVDIYRLQRLLGHSTPTLTARYAKLADGDLKKAVEQMETKEEMKRLVELWSNLEWLLSSLEVRKGKVIPMTGNSK